MSLQTFSSDQEMALLHAGKTVFLSGGPGTGKTLCLFHHIHRLVQTNTFLPEDILFISPSLKGLNIAKEQLMSLAPDLGRVTCHTFYSFAYGLLHNPESTHKRKPNFTIYPARYQHYLLTIIIQDLGFSDTEFNVGRIQEQLQYLKSQSIRVDDYIKNTQNEDFDPDLALIYRHYQERMEIANALDPEDLILFTAQLFTEHPDLASRITHAFKAVIIDDFQEITPSQLGIFNTICAHTPHLRVAADLDQQITSYRGAIENPISKLNAQFPAMETVKLTTQHRMTPIIELAAHHMCANSATFSEYSDSTAYESIEFYVAADDREEAEYIADEIKELKETFKQNYSAIGVLYRTTIQSRILEDVLYKKGIPFQTIGATTLLQLEEIQDLVASLCAMLNPEDNIALLRGFRLASGLTMDLLVPFEELCIKESALTRTPIAFLAESKRLTVPDSEINDQFNLYLKRLTAIKLETRLTEDSVAAVLNRIFSALNLQTNLEDENTLDSLEKLENLQEFLALIEDETQAIQDYASHFQMITESDSYTLQGDRVCLSLISDTRNMEFETVFITGAEDGIIPHYKATLDEGRLKEERRLFFVGMTRAKQRLYLTAANKRHLLNDIWYNNPSRFIKDIPAKYRACFVSQILIDMNEPILHKLSGDGIDFEALARSETAPAQPDSHIKPGDTIEHKLWGRGIVQTVEGEGDRMLVSIRFQDEDRTIMIKYAPIVKV